MAGVWSAQVCLLNSAMVGVGMAYVYQRYVDGCPTAEAMRSSEADARNYRFGVWGRADAVNPWEWRQGKR